MAPNTLYTLIVTCFILSSFSFGYPIMDPKAITSQTTPFDPSTVELGGCNQEDVETPLEKYSYYEIDDMMFVSHDRAGQMQRAYRWPRGRIPFSFAPGYTKYQMNDVRLAMDYIEEFTCIRFHNRKKKSDANYLHFRKLPGKCSSFVGNIQKGPQQVALDPDSGKCGRPTFPGHVLHELVHAIGFFHEHSRNDRDNYIDIRYENLPKGDGTRKNYNRNKDNNLEADYFGVPYNYGSIMHYSQRAGSINRKDTIVPKRTRGAAPPLLGRLGQREKLSYGDIKMIQTMYKSECPGSVNLNDIPDSEEIPDIDDWMEDRVVDVENMPEMAVEDIEEMAEGIIDEVTSSYESDNSSTMSPEDLPPGTTLEQFQPSIPPGITQASTGSIVLIEPATTRRTTKRPTTRKVPIFTTTRPTTPVPTKTPNLYNLIQYAIQSWLSSSG